MERFVLDHTPEFPFKTESVNALQFSPDSKVLAIGTDNGLLLLYDHRNRCIVSKLIGHVPITSILWHPTARYMVFVGRGDGSCNLHKFNHRFERCSPGFITVMLGLAQPGIVDAMDYDVSSQSLAVAAGEHVAIAQANKDFMVWAPIQLPSPNFPNNYSYPIPQRREIIPRSVHFVDGGMALIVTYLNHGIICWDIATRNIKWHIPAQTQLGRSAMAGDGSIVAHNLANGFDKYDIRSLTVVHTFSSPSPSERNVPLPVIRIGDAKLLFGTSIGQPMISDVYDQMSHTLPCGDQRIVQALAFCSLENVKYIALGASEAPPFLTILTTQPKGTRLTLKARAAIALRCLFWVIVSLMIATTLLAPLTRGLGAGFCENICLYQPKSTDNVGVISWGRTTMTILSTMPVHSGAATSGICPASTTTADGDTFCPSRIVFDTHSVADATSLTRVPPPQITYDDVQTDSEQASTGPPAVSEDEICYYKCQDFTGIVTGLHQRWTAYISSTLAVIWVMLGGLGWRLARVLVHFYIARY